MIHFLVFDILLPTAVLDMAVVPNRRFESGRHPTIGAPWRLNVVVSVNENGRRAFCIRTASRTLGNHVGMGIPQPQDLDPIAANLLEQRGDRLRRPFDLLRIEPRR